ncbi:hypothetical protein [Paraburkholderia aromaticivorans]|uniref:Hydroxymethyltransferase n=1 Tax=Paraburkholderia aromaticivorans TaxID=2026199 RepID=A0A248VH13_9BURK|nr:hypothetical protein [Paraburkholderia aromaticivorans]ASV98325.1 hypothetical protein CJU94_09150 [Paraburkholderia aromaticivorans]
MKIEYDAIVGPGANEWYGTIIVSNLRYEDGSAVNVGQFLEFNFHSPANLDATAIQPQFISWVTGATTVEASQIGDGDFDVTATIPFITPYTMQPPDQITIGINGNLVANPDTWLDSFVFAADHEPTIFGTVSAACEAAPDLALASVTPVLTLAQGSMVTTLPLSYGESVTASLEQGGYTVSGDSVSTDDETVVAALVINPASVEVTAGNTATIGVTFGPVERYCALDIAIGSLTGLSSETLSVTLIDSKTGNTLAAFDASTNSVTSLRKLPPAGTAHISLQNVALNDVRYSFEVPAITLTNALQQVTINDSMVTSKPVNTSGYVEVAIKVTADQTLDRQIDLRLVASDMSYLQTVAVQSQQTAFSALVRPGHYTVEATDFLSAGVVYAVGTPAQLNVSGDGRIELDVSIGASANLHVRGFPAYLCFGGCADLQTSNLADFAAARATSVFDYAGTDGAGDSNVFLADDVQTRTTITLARNIETQLDNVQPVLPVMVSYTCNLSLGDTPTILANADAHAHSFANYILALNIATEAIDNDHPVPAGFIVNPDFLGACEQANFGANYAMPVRGPLQTALDHWSISVAIPANITEDIAGYVLAVNWLTRTVAPSVTFGWQINLWGVGYSEWIYEETDQTAQMAQQTAAYVASLGVYDGPYAPDFLAIDRYEADDFTQRAYVNGYCYGPREWKRYFDFCKAVSRALKWPVMPWQIPASRIPNTTDPVATDFDSQHWGTGGSCLLGDPAIGTDYRNVHPTILALKFPSVFQPSMGATAEDMFLRSEPFDISNPMYGDFPLRGIFTVLLGGGATTGIVSAIGNPEAWARDKLNAYMSKPISFDR